MRVSSFTTTAYPQAARQGLPYSCDMGAVRLQHASVQVPDELLKTCCDFYGEAIRDPAGNMIELFAVPPPDPPE